MKKFPVTLRYISDQYKSQEVCDKAVLENGGTLTSVPDCHKKNKKKQICNKAVDNYIRQLEFVVDCHKT